MLQLGQMVRPAMACIFPDMLRYVFCHTFQNDCHCLQPYSSWHVHAYPCDIDHNMSNNTTDPSRGTHQHSSISSTATHLPTISLPLPPKPLFHYSPPPSPFHATARPTSTTTTQIRSHPDCHSDRTHHLAPLHPHPTPPPNKKKPNLSNTASPEMKVSVAVFRANIDQSQGGGSLVG